MIASLVGLIIWICILALIFWLLSLVINEIPEPFRKVARVILILIFVLILVYFLLGALPAIRLPQLR